MSYDHYIQNYGVVLGQGLVNAHYVVDCADIVLQASKLRLSQLQNEANQAKSTGNLPLDPAVPVPVPVLAPVPDLYYPVPPQTVLSEQPVPISALAPAMTPQLPTQPQPQPRPKYIQHE